MFRGPGKLPEVSVDGDGDHIGLAFKEPDSVSDSVRRRRFMGIACF